MAEDGVRAGDGRRAAGSSRLVASGRRRGSLVRYALGWGWIVMGALWCAPTLLMTGWLAHTLVLSRSLAQVFDDGIWLSDTFLDLLALLGTWSVCYLMGIVLLLDAWQLARTRLVVDHRGIGLAVRARPAFTPWERIRHVVVTSGNVGWRRLLVDDGTMPDGWWSASRTLPGRALLRLLPGRRRFAVNIPVDQLDVATAQIVQAIRHYSGGRLPDL